MERFPGENIVGAAEGAAGKVAGKMIALLLSFWFLTHVVVTREFSESFLVAFLPRTPISIVVGISTIIVIYSAYLGLEAIGRVAVLLAPFLLFGVIIINTLDIPFIQLIHYFPVLGTGVLSLFKFALFNTSIYQEIIILAIIRPYLRRPQDLLRIGLTSLGISWFLITSTVMMYQGLFPILEGSRLFFPFYQMIKAISFGEFFGRLDSIYIFIWSWAGMLHRSITLLGNLIIITHVFNIPDHRPLIWPVMLIATALMFLPPNMVVASNFDTNILRTYGFLPTLVVPALLLGLAVIRGKGVKQEK